MVSHAIESDVPGTPFFMLQHVVVQDAQVTPIEGVDYVYDDITQKAQWLTSMGGNKWSQTSYADTKVDGVDFAFPPL